MSLAFLTSEQRDLLHGANIPVLLPCHVSQDRLQAGAQTTERDGARRLVAIEVRVWEDEPTPTLEILTLVRAAPMASIPAGERNEADDSAFMHAYLLREAASGLALRTLKLGDGAAYELTTPLDELISARQRDLPQPSVAELHVNGVQTAASRVVFDARAATWTDLPAAQAAVIVYSRRDAPPLELVASTAG